MDISDLYSIIAVHILELIKKSPCTNKVEICIEAVIAEPVCFLELLRIVYIKFVWMVVVKLPTSVLKCIPIEVCPWTFSLLIYVCAIFSSFKTKTNIWLVQRNINKCAKHPTVIICVVCWVTILISDGAIVTKICHFNSKNTQLNWKVCLRKSLWNRNNKWIPF